MAREYALFLESGPRRRKTMVHVPELLGCTAQGPTTEAALEAAPEAIRAYLRFLQRAGEPVEPEAAFGLAIAAHVMEGAWIGNGDPTPGFTPDFRPLSREDLAIYLRRLARLRAELLELVRDVPVDRLTEKPEGRGRTLFEILSHVAEAQAAYVRTTVGKVDGLGEAVRAVLAGPATVTDALDRMWDVTGGRLAALTETERERTVAHGQVTWTARRGMRRLLEHPWEHLLEISQRLGRQ